MIGVTPRRLAPSRLFGGTDERALPLLPQTRWGRVWDGLLGLNRGW